MLCCASMAGAVAGGAVAGWRARRGHGGLYAALAQGQCDTARLRRALAGMPLRRAGDGRLVLAVDVTCWLRPEALTSAQRILCHTCGRGKDQHIMIPGWPYSVICALEPGRRWWTAPLDARRLAPGDNAAEVAAAQVRQVVTGLMNAGQWRSGDRDILTVACAARERSFAPAALAHSASFSPSTACSPQRLVSFISVVGCGTLPSSGMRQIAARRQRIHPGQFRRQPQHFLRQLRLPQRRLIAYRSHPGRPVQPGRPRRALPRALAKAATKQTPAALPVRSFATLADLGAIYLNTIAPADPAVPGSGSSAPPLPCSGRPSSCSASVTASGSRSQQPGSAHHENQVNGQTCGSLEGTSA